MRLKSFEVLNNSGLDHVSVENLSDVVVIAGPNGVGKTRLIRLLMDFFRAPEPKADIRATLEATSDWERKNWGKSSVTTADAEDAQSLRNTLQRTQRRSNYKSTILNFDSDRAISQVKPFNFTWDISDPYEEDLGWDISYSYLRDRFQDVQHSLFKLVENQRRKLAETAVKLRAAGKTSMDLDFPDPLDKFKEAFSRLLAPKELVGIDLRTQKIIYQLEGHEFPVDTLSSGEREVVNIVFDYLLRNPSDCIIFFDEPELHLHPELSYKLLQTLAAIGRNNQFIFCTHSPEIITASIENTVIFLTPKKLDKANQALIVSRDDATHNALNLLGQSIGIISLGRRLLLIEGDEASLDKQTYGAILQNEFPELVIVPVGGKSTIRSFEEVRDSVLNKTIWGVEFFMLCDRDAVYSLGPQSLSTHVSERLRVLPRYHLENYFLDDEVLATVFSEMEPQSWLADPSAVSAKLCEFATQTIPLTLVLNISANVRERVGNVSIMPKDIGTNRPVDELIAKLAKRIEEEKNRIDLGLDILSIETDARREHARLVKAVEDGTWRVDVPGRIVFNRFAGLAQLKPGRLKTLYLKHAKNAACDPFEEIRSIFRGFRNVGRT
jgi:predicted ATP-binding protein involved in virulence